MSVTRKASLSGLIPNLTWIQEQLASPGESKEVVQLNRSCDVTNANFDIEKVCIPYEGLSSHDCRE